MATAWLALPGLLIWLAILLLPWRPWLARESLDADHEAGDRDLSDVTVVIPARNEEAVIRRTLRSLAGQGRRLRVLLVDDQSTDGTAAAARDAGLASLEILPGEPLPRGWTGKLWALEQGRKCVTTPYVLQLDADIELRPGTIAALRDAADRHGAGLVSLMARLRMHGFWELALMPAFIFFFRLLYPFHLSNSGSRLVAAAAGGCILVRSDVLADIGGYGALKGELIDDCALAHRVRKSGHGTWIGLTHSAVSHREYNNLRVIWDMVARTAFTQLHHSAALLLICSALLAAAFVFPVLVLVAGDMPARLCALLTLALMELSYFPTLRYYHVPLFWGVTLPFTGTLYLLMTWTSAFRYWFGAGAQWKDRNYPGTARP